MQILQCAVVEHIISNEQVTTLEFSVSTYLKIINTMLKKDLVKPFLSLHKIIYG